MRVVKYNRPRIKPLPYVRTTNQQESLALRPSRHPRKRKVGDKVIVVVESTDIAVAARKEHFDDLTFVAFERSILKELARLVARNGMARPSHVVRTIRRGIEPNSRVNRIPKSEIGNGNAKLVEPRREVPRDERPA